MKLTRLFIFSLLSFVMFTTLQADPRRCTANDTVVPAQNDHKGLIHFLKGTWTISGSWTVEEGQGKIVKKIKGRITGAETFTPILNGHFLQKQLNARVKYNSRDLGKSVQNAFSAMTVLTFNNNLNQFYSWYFDCSGSYVESEGSFDHDENHYSFNSKVMDGNRQEIDQLFTMIIVDDNHYRWEVKQRKNSTANWEVTATGLSTRKR